MGTHVTVPFQMLYFCQDHTVCALCWYRSLFLFMGYCLNEECSRGCITAHSDGNSSLKLLRYEGRRDATDMGPCTLAWSFYISFNSIIRCGSATKVLHEWEHNIWCLFLFFPMVTVTSVIRAVELDHQCQTLGDLYSILECFNQISFLVKRNFLQIHYWNWNPTPPPSLL